MKLVHLVHEFVPASGPWLYDLVSADGIEPASPATVLCELRSNAQDYPWPQALAVLPRRRRFTPAWAAWQATMRLPVAAKPSNYWAHALREYAGAADICHAHFGDAGWMAVDAGLRRVVTSFYGYDASAAYMLRYWGRGYPDLFARGTFFVAEGPAMSARLVALGAPLDRARVVPLIADVDQPLRLRHPSDRPEILMAGRFTAKKGFEDGIRAFARVMLDVPCRLTLMGSGPLGKRLRATALECDVAEFVRFRPFGSRAEFRDALDAADIFLQPSRTAPDGDTEGGAPTTLLDAQARGLVVVASTHADLPFVVSQEAGYFANEGDVSDLTRALQAALEGQGDWARRSAAGRAHVERQHGRDQVIRLLRALYEEALDVPA